MPPSFPTFCVGSVSASAAAFRLARAGARHRLPVRTQQRHTPPRPAPGTSGRSPPPSGRGAVWRRAGTTTARALQQCVARILRFWRGLYQGYLAQSFCVVCTRSSFEVLLSWPESVLLTRSRLRFVRRSKLVQEPASESPPHGVRRAGAAMTQEWASVRPKK